jgi:PAS domain S-box-containing protein
MSFFVQKVIRKIKAASLENKMFLSYLAVIVPLSLVIAIFTRWILVSTLTSELKQRGVEISHYIADGGSLFLVNAWQPGLQKLVRDTRQKHPQKLIAYIFITDSGKNIFAASHESPLPPSLNRVIADKTKPWPDSRRLQKEGLNVFEVGTPIMDGHKTIGMIHLGIKKTPIDRLIAKLRNTFIGFMSAITILFFGISHRFSRYVTRPLARLTRIANAISQGRFEDDEGESEPGVKKRKQPKELYGEKNRDQNVLINTGASSTDSEMLGEKNNPAVDYNAPIPVPPSSPADMSEDEVAQLAHAFYKMTVQLQHSQKELQASEAKYRSLFHSGPNPIFVLDRYDLTILDINPNAVEVFDCPRDQAVGKPFNYLGRLQYEEQDLIELVQKGWPEKNSLPQNAKFYRKKSELPIYIRLRGQPTIYKDKEALVLAASDVTEMVEKEAQLIQASKMSSLGEMSAGMAHELNQPLNAIKIGNEYLTTMAESGRDVPNENLLTVAGEVSAQVSRAAEIINGLRDFGRKTDFAKEKVILNAPIEGVLRLVKRQLALDGIEVETNLNPDLPFILAHANRLEQVIFNLTVNAGDAIRQKMNQNDCETKGRIVIKTDYVDKNVVLSIKDNGVGIDSSLQHKIFEPFFTTKEIGKGLGLGLTIIYGMVEDYGGHIDVKSDKGEGTTFTLTFPANI